jgi:predicted  nucleic acid-binding Zn-ribbon protein
MNAQVFRLVPTVVAVAVLTAAGCSSTGRSTSTKTADAVQDLQGRISMGEATMNTAVGALVNLVSKPEADLRPQYKEFLNALNKLEAQIKKGQSGSGAMKTHADAYFSKWEEETKSIQNEQIKATMEARRVAVQAMFSKIETEFKTGKPIFEQFMRDLREIKKALDFDLTINGVTAIKPIVEKAKKESVDISKHLAAIRDELNKVAREMSASSPATQPK